MPTPPLRRRNPAVSIRRVHSERNNLSTWGASPMFPTWTYNYARRTAMIPQLVNQPHMIGTSQGVLGRGSFSGFNYPLPHSLSEAHLQPILLMAPPLIVGAYPPPRKEFVPPRRIPLTEDEILAQERINAFLKEVPPTHTPKSLISYPESHLYESLISRESDSSKDESSEENIYQKLGKTSGADSEDAWSDSSSFENKKTTTKPKDTPKNTPKAPEPVGKISEVQVPKLNSEKGRSNEYILKPIPVNKNNNNLTYTKSSIIKLGSSNNFLNEFNDKVENKIKSDENSNGVKRKLSFLGCSKSYLKSFFKIKKKEIEPTNSAFQNIDTLSVPTTVSVVHVNKENGSDEVSVRESICYKCDSRLAGQSHSDIGSTNHKSGKIERYQKIPKKSQSLDFSQGKRLQRSSTFASGSKENLLQRRPSRAVFRQQSPLISPTLELPESVPHKSNFSVERKSDKGVQVSSEDIARSQIDLETFLTLDPLKTSISTIDTRTKVDKGTITPHSRNSSNKSHQMAKELHPFNIEKNQKDRILKNSFTNPIIHRSPNLLKKNQKNAFLSQRSLRTSNLNRENDSVFYVFGPYKNPLNKPSRILSTDDYKINSGRGGGSSGLGSSGSETSYEEAAHETSDAAITEKVQIRTRSSLESSPRSSYDSSLSSLSSLRSSRGCERGRKLCFDYSWSWSHLNELVKKIPRVESRKKKPTHSMNSLSLSAKFKDISGAFDNL